MQDVYRTNDATQPSVMSSQHTTQQLKQIKLLTSLAKDTGFKFDTHAAKDSPDMTPEQNYQNGGAVRVTCPGKFWGMKC